MSFTNFYEKYIDRYSKHNDSDAITEIPKGSTAEISIGTLSQFSTPMNDREMDSIQTIEFTAGTYDYASVFAQAAAWLSLQDVVLIGISHTDIEDVTVLYLHYDR